MIALEISITASLLTLIVRFASSAPIAFSCRHHHGPVRPWEQDARRSLGREAHLDHDEELAELERLGLEGRMRHVVQKFHDPGRLVHRDLEVTAHDLRVHHEGIDAGLYVRNRSDRRRVGCS
jgi:hypothetical protein